MTSHSNPNRARLLATARCLRPLLPELVFVGGHAAELLVTEPGAVNIRPTVDVDVIVETATLSAYDRLHERLREIGFQPAMEPDAPTCRSRTADGLVLDVMPVDARILGFSNRWYGYAVESAVEVALEPSLVIRAATAPAFLAMKWEAFAGRGSGDADTSHDVEDIVIVVAGRPGIVDDVRRAPEEVQAFVAECTRAFLGGMHVEDIIDSKIPDARRFPEIGRRALNRFRALAGR